MLKKEKKTYKEVTNKKDKEIIGLMFENADLKEKIEKLQQQNTELKEKLKTQAKEIFKEMDRFPFISTNKYLEIKKRFEK